MTDITENIENYINSQNRELYETLNKRYNIRLLHDENEYSWLVQKTNLSINIICPNLTVNYSAFTHELLHIYIEDLGMIDYNSFYSFYQNDSVFGNFIFTNLFGYIYNFSCHKKMFPYYKNLGFSEYEFVGQRIDYSLKRHYTIYLCMKIKKFNLFGIDQFLGNFFALKNNVVAEDKLKCDRFLRKLRKINPELYDIADKFDKNWENSKDLNFLVLFHEFTNDLKNWLLIKYSR